MITQLAPKIEIGDPYDVTFSVCETDFVRDCSYDFGDVGIGQPKHFAFVIKNPSPVDLVIKSIAFAEGSSPRFSLEGELPEIIEHQVGALGKLVDVKFDPDVESQQAATLLIASDAENLAEGELVEIALTATGVDLGAAEITVTPPQCDFGAVGVGSTAFCDLSITNEGSRELMISGIGFSPGTDTGVFGNQSVFPVPTFVAPGTGTSLRLYASPTNTAVLTGELFLDTNDPDEGHVLVPLSVQGAQAPTAVARVKSINGVANSNPTPAVEPLDNVVVSGDESTPGNPGAVITAYQWELIEQPPESSAVLTAPSGVDTGIQFSSATGTVQGLDVAGTFVFRLTVTDSTGAVSTNDARVTLNAVPTDGIHVQLTWSASVDDIDLHLGRTSTPDWCSQDDCYYGNCQGSVPPNWDGAAGVTPGDPTLDIDDLSGFGPENINVDTPVNGTYVVGVHAFSGNGSAGGFTPTDVTIKVFLNGALAIEKFGHLGADDDFWTPLRIDWNNGVGTASAIDSMQSSWSCF